MPTKTITLEIDAYEKLRLAKRGGESFTEVVRRAVIPDTPPKGGDLRKYYRQGGGNISPEYLDSAEQAAAFDPVPDDPWAGSNDLWIAATALVHGMPVVTQNLNEFERVPGLEVISY